MIVGWVINRLRGGVWKFAKPAAACVCVGGWVGGFSGSGREGEGRWFLCGRGREGDSE